MSWMKTGAESQAIAAQDAQEQEQRKLEMGKMYRFSLKHGEEARITFVDGGLDDKGHLTPPRYYEHTIQVGGKWNNFVCPEKTNPSSGDKCPICAAGNKPYLASVFTVIDHRTIVGKNDKVYKDMPRLLVVKPTAFEIIAHKAKKYGGLAGATFDVARLGENSSTVGDNYDFIERNTAEVLQQKYVRTYKNDAGVEVVETNFVPAEYDKEIIYRTGDELRALGLGTASAATPVTSSKPDTVVQQTPYVSPSQQFEDGGDGADVDYSKEL